MTARNEDGGYIIKSWLDAAAVVDEKQNGPLPDVVSTQGRYLKSRPNTPIFEREYDHRFVKNLEVSLNGLLFRQDLRGDKYGIDIAEEFPPGLTPTEIRERWKAEQEANQRRLDALLEIPTPPTPEDVRKARNALFAAKQEEARLAWESHLAAEKRKLDEMSPSSAYDNTSTSTPTRKRRKTYPKEPAPSPTSTTTRTPPSSSKAPCSVPFYIRPPMLRFASAESTEEEVT